MQSITIQSKAPGVYRPGTEDRGFVSSSRGSLCPSRPRWNHSPAILRKAGRKLVIIFFFVRFCNGNQSDAHHGSLPGFPFTGNLAFCVGNTFRLGSPSLCLPIPSLLTEEAGKRLQSGIKSQINGCLNTIPPDGAEYWESHKRLPRCLR